MALVMAPAMAVVMAVAMTNAWQSDAPYPLPAPKHVVSERERFDVA